MMLVWVFMNVSDVDGLMFMVEGLQVIFYTVRNDVQASFDEVMHLATRGLAYPLKESKRTTRFQQSDDVNSAILPGGIGRFLGRIAHVIDWEPISKNSRASQVHPARPHNSRNSAVLTSSKATWLLRQSLAERDLVVKRMVQAMGLPELHTPLMGQWEDSAGRPVLVMEVPYHCLCFRHYKCSSTPTSETLGTILLEFGAVF
jgi:hypothetical protein